MDLTEVASHVARQLLQEMKWNYEAVAELYYEDTDKLLAKAGVVAATRVQKSNSGFHLTEKAETFTCQVCYEDFEGAEQVAANVREYPSCGHAMCKGCWFQQLKTQIIDEGVCVRIACPGFSMVGGKVVRCNIILDERFVDNLLKEVLADGDEPEAGRVLKHFEKHLNDNYVNNNQCIKWCPVSQPAAPHSSRDEVTRSRCETSEEEMCRWLELMEACACACRQPTAPTPCASRTPLTRTASALRWHAQTATCGASIARTSRTRPLAAVRSRTGGKSVRWVCTRNLANAGDFFCLAPRVAPRCELKSHRAQKATSSADPPCGIAPVALSLWH